MDRPFKQKYGTVSQSTLAPGCSKQPNRKDQKTSYKYKKPRKVKKVAVVDPAQAHFPRATVRQVAEDNFP